MNKEKPETETTAASKALPSSSGSGRIGQSAPNLEEADMLIERLFACAVAHMTHYNRTPFSENFHPVHREIWHQTIDYQNRRMLAKATFTYVDDQNKLLYHFVDLFRSFVATRHFGKKNIET